MQQKSQVSFSPTAISPPVGPPSASAPSAGSPPHSPAFSTRSRQNPTQPNPQPVLPDNDMISFLTASACFKFLVLFLRFQTLTQGRSRGTAFWRYSLSCYQSTVLIISSNPNLLITIWGMASFLYHVESIKTQSTNKKARLVTDEDSP